MGKASKRWKRPTSQQLPPTPNSQPGYWEVILQYVIKNLFPAAVTAVITLGLQLAKQDAIRWNLKEIKIDTIKKEKLLKLEMLVFGKEKSNIVIEYSVSDELKDIYTLVEKVPVKYSASCRCLVTEREKDDGILEQYHNQQHYTISINKIFSRYKYAMYYTVSYKGLLDTRPFSHITIVDPENGEVTRGISFGNKIQLCIDEIQVVICVLFIIIIIIVSIIDYRRKNKRK
ncbi:hypothetical protein [Foetidibacter luteolus]|uniref:hypothetical protein n=1 Tax=Foetidibacter luteolus TaxID=2608880 RepID=UPI00129B0CBC|nr:hypothetical protein [Foetidibacter luteolus]